MSETITVAWLNRPTKERVWCRAKYKKTLRCQDEIKTLCEHVVLLPVGLSAVEPVTCSDCLAIEAPRTT